MIENPNPKDWRALQNSVCTLFNEVGLNAVTEKKLTTPRGEVEIDVYAVDESSVERIQYIVECKNWANPIPQSVVHSFTTVMHETGGHIGFIVSRVGFQNGAKQYLQNTNVVGLSFDELQHRYFPIWWKKRFCINIAAAADTLLQYVEPINGLRERKLCKLPPKLMERYEELLDQYALFGSIMSMIDIGRFMSKHAVEPPESIELYKLKLIEVCGEQFAFSSLYFRDLEIEITKRLTKATDEFHEVFGENIFA